MAANVPAKLRSADITRFAQRAAQVESVKPAIAYWCNYWMVQQILAKGLHNEDDECKLYTSQLMDKLEEMKTQHPEDEAIADDMAGQAVVEQFGLETFQRADNVMGANKVTRQTADTFQASATFLDLVQIWGPPTPDIASKIKYAKFHALRIAKALKAGEDPNLTNPAPTPAPEQDAVQLDPNDPEVRQFTDVDHQPTVEDAPDDTDRMRRLSASQSMFDQSLHPSRDASTSRLEARTPPRHPKVEDVSDDQHHLQAKAAATSHLDQSLHPSRAPSAPPGSNGTVSPYTADNAAVSPGHNLEESQKPRQNSVGGGYFPEIQLPAVPQEPEVTAPSIGPISPTGYITPSKSYPPNEPQEFYTRPTEPPQAPFLQSQPPPQVHQQPTPLPAPIPQARYQGASIPPPAAIREQHPNFVPDEEAVMLAQKHAKWAISALNFEDVPTAIKELRNALQQLGAS